MEHKYAIENLKKIAGSTGRPVYLFNADRFIRNFVDLQSTFRRIYPNTEIAYSYKTNYSPEICKLVKDLGGYAETVSPIEYEIANDIVKHSYKKIIYNGLLPERISSYVVLENMVNVGTWRNLKEALNSVQTAKALYGKDLAFGIRIAIDESSRFGFTENEMKEVLDLTASRKATISGIHCHAGGSRGLSIWSDKAKTAIRIAKMVEESQGKEIQYIDLGGHLYGRMDPELKSQFGGYIPTFEDYANHVGAIVKEEFGDRKNPPKLILEPGTSLVADAVDILTEVQSITERKNGKKFATLNVSSYDCGMTADYKNLPIINVSCQEQEPTQVYTVCGYTCMEADYIHRKYFGNLKEGDTLLIRNCGAYSLSLKGDFFYPPIAMYKVNDHYEVMGNMRSAGNREDVLRKYWIGDRPCVR